MHGLACSSDVFILNEENMSPAFILANQDYDIWIPNNRGNTYSRNHINIITNDKKYW